jgi:hypothetical protein
MAQTQNVPQLVRQQVSVVLCLLDLQDHIGIVGSTSMGDPAPRPVRQLVNEVNIHIVGGGRNPWDFIGQIGLLGQRDTKDVGACTTRARISRFHRRRLQYVGLRIDPDPPFLPPHFAGTIYQLLNSGFHTGAGMNQRQIDDTGPQSPLIVRITSRWGTSAYGQRVRCTFVIRPFLQARERHDPFKIDGLDSTDVAFNQVF